jgi:hypothetical protein
MTNIEIPIGRALNRPCALVAHSSPCASVTHQHAMRAIPTTLRAGRYPLSVWADG